MTPELLERYKERLLDIYTAPELCDILNISAEELLVTFEDKVFTYIKEQMDEGLDSEQDEEGSPEGGVY